MMDDLADFDARTVTIGKNPKTVYVAGSGPAVIIMHEMPGITPHVARFARMVREDGFCVYMPSLFGRDGAHVSAEEGAVVFRAACVSAEFRALGGGGVASPVTTWLAGLAELASEEQGGLGVGAIGMCFTGNFALTMMLNPAVRASILCQPSLPLDNPAGLEISAQDLGTVSDRLERESLGVRGYRFAGDAFCRAERFTAYQNALGDRFQPTVLPDSAASPAEPPPFVKAHIPTPHSIVTTHLVDVPGHPTAVARDQILAFLHEQLDPSASS
jgi:dienelactone hydrolase